MTLVIAMLTFEHNLKNNKENYLLFIFNQFIYRFILDFEFQIFSTVLDFQTTLYMYIFISYIFLMIVSNRAGASCGILGLTVFYFLFHLLNGTVAQVK